MLHKDIVWSLCAFISNGNKKHVPQSQSELYVGEGHYLYLPVMVLVCPRNLSFKENSFLFKENFNRNGGGIWFGTTVETCSAEIIVLIWILPPLIAFSVQKRRCKVLSGPRIKHCWLYEVCLLLLFF